MRSADAERILLDQKFVPGKRLVVPPAAFTPFTPTTLTPTALTPTVTPIPPAVVPIAPSGQLWAALIGIRFGLFDHRGADASDSFRNCGLRRIRTSHFGGTIVG